MIKVSFCVLLKIRERATIAKRALDVKRVEEENRLIAESDYRSKLLMEKVCI